MLYFNLPDLIVSSMYLPTRLFPQSSNPSEKYPDTTKLVEYFKRQGRPVPNVVIAELNVKRFG